MILNNSKKNNYSCIVDTNYTLCLYLLYMSEEAVNRTVFFVGNTIPESVTSELNNVIRFNIKDYEKRYRILRHRLEAIFCWRFRYGTEMYAQDHLVFSSHLIGSKKYTLIEDAPNIFTIYKQVSFMKPHFETSLLARLRSWVYWGRIGRKILGTNNQCDRIIYTSDKDKNSELLIGKETLKLNLYELWKNANLSHQKMVLRIFSLSDFIEELLKKKVILFSQPLVEDCKLTESEVVNIYKPYIERYKNEGVVIKQHPRDEFDYKKWFPDVEILKTPAPMQLLSAIGVTFEVAITICSTAVSSMSKDTNVIWIGSKINPMIESVYGDIKCPV